MNRFSAAWQALPRPAAPSLRRALAGVAVFATLTAAAACGGGGGGNAGVTPPPPPPAVAAVAVSAPGSTTSPVRITLGTTLTLNASVTDASGKAVTGQAVTWSSEAPTIARVDAASGVVTPVAVGQTKIHAAAGGKDGSIDVSVVAATSTVTVTAPSGSGTGTVRSTPAGIDCSVAAGAASGTCTGTFAGDAAVTLTAAPTAGSTFSTWTGDCAGAGSTATCQLPASSAARNVGAVFLASRTLTVAASGTGGGTVTSSAGGINCVAATGGSTSGPCTASLPEGTVVTLTAAANGASSFTGWTGDCASAGTAATCQVTLSQARTAVANFTRRTFTVTVVLSGTGQGSLSVAGSNIAGGSCTLANGSTTCTFAADAGAAVTLTGSPGTTSVFSYRGSCPGTDSGNNCSFTLSGNVTVNGYFTDVRHLSVTPAGNGDGTITGSTTIVCQRTNGQNSAAGCEGDIPTGTVVTLTATAAGGSSFAGWSGDCAVAGTATSCSVTMDRARNVGATFTKP